MSVLKIIQEEVGLYVQPDSQITDLRLDSLDYLDLLIQLETATCVDIPRNKLGSFVTVGDLIDYFEKGECPKPIR